MKRITFKEANYIMRRMKPHRLERIFCYWIIQKKNDNSGWMYCYIKWWAYILFFIPAHILIFVCCLWDGGLKEFRIESRKIKSHAIVGLIDDDAQTKFGRFKIVWEKNNEED